MTHGAAPDHALVHAAIDQVWGAMLYTAAEPWPAGRAAEFETGLQAHIELRGDWTGRLVLTCDLAVATQIAGALLGTAAGEALPAADVHDAVGEVLNVVGGSVKGALSGVTALGLPGVRECSTPPGTDDGFVVSWRGAPVFVQVVSSAA
jgi:chemotaxis protein CheX